MDSIEEFRKQAKAAPIVKPDAPEELAVQEPDASADPPEREERRIAREWVDLRNLPELPPELISGVLRKGHVMILSGPSKSGKTYLLVELAVAVATGKEWLGRQCAKGRVLYIDGETERASALHRFSTVASTMGADPDAVHDGIALCSLRGETDDLQKLVPEIVEMAKDDELALLIIDPAYLFMEGDENSAGDVRGFCKALIRIAEELGCSVVFAHHHSKGAKGDVAGEDRMSGSGVFARFPDAVVDLVKLVPSDGDEALPERTTAWRFSFPALREFWGREPLNVLFDCSDGRPHHVVDVDGLADGMQPMTASRKGGMARAKQVKAATKEKEHDMCLTLTVMEHYCTDGKIPTKEAMKLCGLKDRTNFGKRVEATGRWKIVLEGNKSYTVRC